MSETRHTQLSRDRKLFIQRSLSQSSGRECNQSMSPMQKCARKIDTLKIQIARAEEELEKMNLGLENLHYNMPITIKNARIANEKEIQTQSDVLEDVARSYERSQRDIHVLTLKEKHLTEEVERLLSQHAETNAETQKRNYNLFKKGLFLGYLEEEESIQLQEPCQWDDIESLWSDIQAAEMELLKWQSIDYERTGQPRVMDDDLNEYLIGFIKDALYHFLMDDISPRKKQEQLDLLIAFFRFSDQEMMTIKKRNAWPT